MITIPTSIHYNTNQDRFPCPADVYPCAVCGKPVPNPEYWLTIVGGGGQAERYELADHLDAGFMGCYPIGKDCLRKHPELKQYAQKDF